MPVPNQVKADLKVAGRVVLAAAKGLPIVARPSEPPLNFIRFTSDAAGASWATVDGRREANPGPGHRGVASVYIDEEGCLTFAARMRWPEGFLYRAQNEKGCYYGDKSTTLETIGLLLPFLAISEEVAKRHVVLQVDNVAAIYGWESRQVKGNVLASILIRALHLVSSYLACKIYPKPLPLDPEQHVELLGSSLLSALLLTAPLPRHQLAAPLQRPQMAALLPRRQLAAPLQCPWLAVPLSCPQVASLLPRSQSAAPLHESPVHLPLMPLSSLLSPADQELIQNLQNQIALQQQLLQLQQQSQQLIVQPIHTLGQTPLHLSPTSMSSALVVYSPETELATELPLRDVNNFDNIFELALFWGEGGK